jgi:hypothetical protein
MKLSLNRMGVKASDLIIKPAKPESAKVTKSLEEALADVKLEWIEE